MKMFSKMFVWCVVVVALVKGDLVPYTLGGTTIMVDSNVLGYNSPLLSSLIQGMPHRSGHEVYQTEATPFQNVHDSHQHQDQHTLSDFGHEESVSTDFETDSQGHLNIKVINEDEHPNKHWDDKDDLRKPITIEEAAGIYLGDERIPFTNGFNKPPYYSVPTPDVADVSEKIHHIVSALNQETTGAKLNDRAPLPIVPPIPGSVGFDNDQFTQYPVPLEEELSQETTMGSLANVDDSFKTVATNDTKKDDMTTSKSEISGTFSDGDLNEAMTILGSTSTETYLFEKNVIHFNPEIDLASVSQLSEISNSDDDAFNDFSETGQTTAIPFEESTSIPLEEVLLQKEEELALLHQEETQNIQEELEDQMALDQAMADMLGTLFSGEEETGDDSGTQSSADEASTIAMTEITETQAPILFDPLISESIIHDLNKQVQSNGPETETAMTSMEVDQQSDDTLAEKTEKQDDNIALQIQPSVQDSSSNSVQAPIVTEQKSESTKPLNAHAAIETASTYDQAAVKPQEEKQEDSSNVKITQQIKSPVEDERKDPNIHNENKQDLNTKTGQPSTESSKEGGINSVKESEANQYETKDDEAVSVLNTYDGADQVLQIPFPDSSMFANFPPARGEPTGGLELDSPTLTQPDDPSPVFLYSPHSLSPITLDQAGGVYVNGEQVFNNQYSEHPSGYLTRHDPPSPDSGLLTWYDQDPINIFDPLQAERVTGAPQGSGSLSPQFQTPRPIPNPKQPDNEVNVGRPIPGSVPSLRPAVPTSNIPADDGVRPSETTNNKIETGGAVFHSANPDILQKATCNCGLRFNTKIVGGESTTIDQFPWMAAITSTADNFTFCGGSLLNDKYVLTAAHCVDGQDPRDMYVRFGETSRDYTKSTNIPVKKFIIHKKYDSYVVYKNDIALIELARPIPAFTDRIFPVCIATGSEKYNNETATVSGWGRNSFGGDVTQGLMEATVNVLSTKECRQTSKYEKYEVHNKIVCALGDGIDACQGDSGGPLVVLENDHYKQLGIVSWGIGCAQPDFPGIYTRVSAYSNWILSNIKDGTGCRVGATNTNINKGNKNKNKNKKNKNKKKNGGMIGGSRPLFSILNRVSGNANKDREDQQDKNNNNKKTPIVNRPPPAPEAEETKFENQRPGANNSTRNNENKSPITSSNAGGFKLPNLRRPESNNNRNNPSRRKNQHRNRPGQGNKAQNTRQDVSNDQNKEKRKPETPSAVVTQEPPVSSKPVRGNNKPAQGQKMAVGDGSNNKNNDNNTPAGIQNHQKNRPQRNKNKNKTNNRNNEGNNDGLDWSKLRDALKGIGEIINKEKVPEIDHSNLPQATQVMHPVMSQIVNVDAPL